MADLYLKAFRDWFDRNADFLTQNSFRVSILKEFQDATNSIAYAEVETLNRNLVGMSAVLACTLCICKVGSGKVGSGKVKVSH